MKKLIQDQPTLPTAKAKTIPFPEKIGPYKIESLFKKGGMSILYLGVHPETKKPIMIKVLSPRFVSKKEMVDRFLKEAEIIKLSNHPNIIKIFDQGRWDKGLYIAMEFIQGISLKQFLLEKSLSLKKALEIILQVSYALCHLHTHNIIHRDLKPENILITETGEIKVIDFGIAQLTKEKEERITKRKLVMGTPVYMSPEQKEDPKKVGFPSDIYSLAIITYELVLGRLSHGVIHLSLLPKGLRNILGKALKLNIKDRYQDIVDFITDISEYIKIHEEEKEIEEDEKFDKLYSSLKKVEDFLLVKPPIVKRLDIGLSKEIEFSLQGLYIDFINIKENSHLIILAKSKESFIESFFYLSSLKAMIKTKLSHNHKDLSLSELLNDLNKIITTDFSKFCFSISLILLDLEKDLLISSSTSEDIDSYHVIEATNKINSINTPNLLLGKDSDTNFVETKMNFNIGDRVILISEKINPQKEMLFKKTVQDNLLHSSMHLIEKIHQNSKTFFHKKIHQEPTIISIQRKF